VKTASDVSKSVIDSVQVGEIDIDAITHPDSIIMDAKMALVDSRTGRRYGFANRSSWSPETIARLRALLESMESDALQQVFGDTASSGGPPPGSAPADGIPGL
jgi:hypothetical protein